MTPLRRRSLGASVALVACLGICLPDDTVPGRPLPNAGVIDPSGFEDSDGTRFLLYE